MRTVFQAGATSKSVYFRAWTAADSLPKTDIAWNTSGFTCGYVRNRAAVTAITLATLVSSSAAFSSGGFIVTTGNLYRLDVPDTALASGVNSVEVQPILTGVVFEPCAADLMADDPNATAGTAQTGDNFVRLGAPAGASVSADLAAAKADTAAILIDTGTTLDGRIPAALVGGKIDAAVSGAVGSVTGNVSGNVVGTVSGVTPAAAGAAMTLTAGERTATADAILDRNMGTGTDSGTSTLRTVRQALRTLRNRFTQTSVYKEDDITISHNIVVTGSPAVTEVNPEG